MLRRPEISYHCLPSVDPSLSPVAVRHVEIRLKYEGYIERETRMAAKSAELDSVKIPAQIDYWSLPSLRHEAREKFSRIRPESLGQAGRIPGITPSDVSVLYITLSAAIR